MYKFDIYIEFCKSWLVRERGKDIYLFAKRIIHYWPVGRNPDLVHFDKKVNIKSVEIIDQAVIGIHGSFAVHMYKIRHFTTGML